MRCERGNGSRTRDGQTNAQVHLLAQLIDKGRASTRISGSCAGKSARTTQHAIPFYNMPSLPSSSSSNPNTKHPTASVHVRAFEGPPASTENVPGTHPASSSAAGRGKCPGTDRRLGTGTAGTRCGRRAGGEHGEPRGVPPGTGVGERWVSAGHFRGVKNRY